VFRAKHYILCCLHIREFTLYNTAY
jgi:hypothetical protein